MKSIIEKTIVALMLVCATGGAWATKKPAALWFRDFEDNGAHGNYTFSLNNASSGEGNSISDGVVTIGSTSSDANGGVRFMSSNARGKVLTVVARMKMKSGTSQDVSNIPVLYSYRNGRNDNTLGVVLKTDGTMAAAWDLNAQSGASTATVGFSDSSWDFTAARFRSDRPSGSAQDGEDGTTGYFNGTQYAYNFACRNNDYNLYGVTLGGAYNSKTRNFSNLQTDYVVVFEAAESAISSDISAWSLTGMTAAETVANEETITGGSNVGVNLSTANMTATVSGATTAAAMFVQENATLKITAGALTIGGGTGPLYVADTKTLTIDASEYDVSGLEDGDSIKIVDGVIYGSPTLVAPADTAEYLYNLFLGNDNGVYLSVQSANVELTSININFYMDRDGDKATYSAASKLTTAADVGLGGYAVPGNLWTEMAAANGTLSALLAVDSENTKAYPVQVSATISGAYQTGWYTTGFTANADVRYGYIDDNESATAPTITISNIPFDSYRVVVYHAPSSSYLGYDTINGINLDYSAGNIGIGTSQWGAPSQVALAEGKNVLVSGVYTSSTLTIAAHRISDSARANIAAIQIIKDSVPTDDVAVSITKPSSDWDSLTLPTTAKLYGICAASSSANEESFGNNSTYLQTLGGRDATVVVVTNGVYTGVNGLIKKTETYSGGTRDTYLIIDGGAVSVVKGRQTKGWGTGTGDTTGNSLTQIGANAVVGYVYGAGEEGGNTPVLTGSSGVTVKNGAVVTGSIIGGWSSSHQATPRVTQNTSVRVEGLQSVNTAPARAKLPNNYIVGGSVHQTNYASGSKVDGNSSVVIDLPAEASGTFSKCIVGGSLCAHSTDDGGSQNIGGNTSVAITANENVTFNQLIVGGTCSFHSNSDYASTVTGNSSVILNGAVFDGNRIVAGGYATTAGMSTVAKNATLTVNSGTTFNGATLDGGNANQTKKLVANTAIDTSTVTVTGFDALDVGAGVTQAAITQASGEFAEITVHDGAQYTAATTGTSNLRVVSSTDGGTKGIVVFDGLASTYTGNITIASGANARLVSGTYTGTFTVESGATLEIDPGAAYSCAASFTGAGNVVVKSGPVTFTGANTLSNGITVDDGGIAVAAVTGDEGLFDVLSGGTLRLYVTTDQYQHEGNVFKGTNNGTVEYYHGTEADYSDYVKVTDSNSLNGNNLLPYYQIWKVVGDATEGNINTAANWPGASAVPTVRADETYGNAAFYVASGTVTVNIGDTMNFSEMQVYGSGTVIFKSDGTHYLSANYLSMTSGVNVQISGGEALKLSNGEIIAATSSQTITINSGAKLSLDGINCTNKIVCNGTLETAGTTTLSGANTSASGSLIEVVGGETTLSSQYDGLRGNITIDQDAKLIVGSAYYSGNAYPLNHVAPRSSAIITVKGELDLQSNCWEFGKGITLNLHGYSKISGVATEAAGGSIAWNNNGSGEGRVNVYGNAIIDARIRTSTGNSAEFDIAESVTLTIQKPFVSQSITATNYGESNTSGGSLTKAGAGTLKFTQEELTKPITISAGKVQLKKAFTSGLAISIAEGAELELGVGMGDTDVNATGISFAGLTGDGTIRYSSEHTGYYTQATSAANMFATTLHVANDNTGKGIVIGWSGGVTTNRTVSGSGKYRSDWSGSSGVADRYFLALQDDDSEWGGIFHEDDRMYGMKVAGVEGATHKTLTLSGTQTQTNTLEVEPNGSVNLTGTWVGDTTVDGEFGGTGTVSGNLTFNAGSTFKVWATGGLSVTGGITFPETSLTVDVSDLTIGRENSTVLLTATSGSNFPTVGNFTLTGSSTHVLSRTAQKGLSLLPIIATYSRNDGSGIVTPYADSVDMAINALVTQKATYPNAYVTVFIGAPSYYTAELLASNGIALDDETGNYVIAEAKIDDTLYPTIEAAIADAGENDTVELARDSSRAGVEVNTEIAFSEGEYTFTGSFTGSGTLIMTAMPKDLASARWAAGWEGTLWLKGVEIPKGDDAAEPVIFGNATSTLRLTGCTGGFNKAHNSDGSLASCTLDLRDDGDTPAFEITSGFPNYGFTSFAKLTGSGTLKSSESSSVQCYRFADASEFAGSITIGGSSTLRIVLGGENNEGKGNGNTEFLDTSHNRQIVVRSGASAAVAAGKAWTAPGGFAIDGNLSVANTSTLTGTITGGGTITYAALPASAPTFGTWTGTVVLPTLGSIAGNTFSFNDYGISGSTVRITTIGGGWVKNETVNPTIDVETSLTLTDFSAGNNNTFTKITGSGALNLSCNESAIFVDANTWYSNYSAYFLVNDLSGFSGSISVSNLGLAIGDSKPDYKTAGNKIIVNSGKTATVGASKSWTAQGGITVDGTVNAAAVSSLSGQISGSGLIAYTTMPNSDTTSPSFGTWSGTIELPEATADGIKLAGYGTSTSKIKVNGITSGCLMWEDQNVQAEIVLAGGINITATSHRNYTYAHISGTGFISVANSNEPAADPATLIITRLDVASGSVGMAVTNTTSTTLTIATLALAEGADVSTGAKILSKGGTGIITVGGVTLGGVAISPSLEYKTDGVYIALDPGVGYMDDTTAVITNTASIVTTIPASATVAKIFPVTEGFKLAAEDGFVGSVQVLAKYIDANEDVQEQNIAGIFTIANYGTIWTLNSSALVGGVKLQPEVAATTPMTMGANTTFSIKTIPGLYYAVQTGSFNGSGEWVPAETSASGNAVQAISGTTSVTAPELDEDDVVKYYRIGVGLTPDGAK